jgi:hypothetical protein
MPWCVIFCGWRELVTLSLLLDGGGDLEPKRHGKVPHQTWHKGDVPVGVFHGRTKRICDGDSSAHDRVATYSSSFCKGEGLRLATMSSKSLGAFL